MLILLRQSVATLFFVAFLAMFLGGSIDNILPGWIIKVLPNLQVTPVLAQVLQGSITGTILLAFLILLTLLFGRIYCSTLCPLGILMDVIGRLARTFKKRKQRFSYKKPRKWLRYSILGVMTLSLFSGSVAFLGYLDPYSIFGRITSVLFRPVYFAVSNSIAALLMKFNYYSLHPVLLHGYSFFAFIITFSFFVLIVWMTIKNGRRYCNTICPIGTLLGLLSRFSLYKIKSNESSCTHCQRCVKACKAGCINPDTIQIDYTRCVSCFNCLKACKTDHGLTYGIASLPKKNTSPPIVDSTRRKFLISTILSSAVLAGFSQGRGKGKHGKGRPTETGIDTTPFRPHPILPPGASSLAHFTSTCISCHLCVSVCDTSVLHPTTFGYGIKGLMMPQLDPEASFCAFDCKRCTDICPTGALKPLTLKEKQRTSLGKAVFLKRNCVVFVNHENCGACAEHCPVKAVRMVPFKEGLLIPEVNTSLCIGCGACEYICPTRPHRAIYVKATTVHELAAPPIQTENKFEIEEEFPF